MLSGIQKSLRETQYTLVTLMEPRNEADIEKFLQSIKTIRPNGIIYSFYYGVGVIAWALSAVNKDRGEKDDRDN